MTGHSHTDPRDIVNRRTIDAPRELVFQAFTNPQVLARWWGPKGFTNTFTECDVRPGGHWRFTMHAPNGSAFGNHCVFEEIAPPERIVIHHLGPMHDFTLTVTLDKTGNTTDLTWHMRFATAAERERVGSHVAVANEENIDRLVSQLI